MEICSNKKCWIAKAKAFSSIEADKHGHLYVSSCSIVSLLLGLLKGRLAKCLRWFKGISCHFQILFVSFCWMPSTHSLLCFGVWNACSWTLICSSWRDAKASTLTSDTSGVSLQPWATTWECDVQSKVCRLSVSCLLWLLVFAPVVWSVSSLTAWICMVISPKSHNMKQHVTTSHDHLWTS